MGVELGWQTGREEGMSNKGLPFHPRMICAGSGGIGSKGNHTQVMLCLSPLQGNGSCVNGLLAIGRRKVPT